MSPLSIRLRELREAKGWTQAELAERAGVRQATVSSLETAASRKPKRRLVDLAAVEKLASALRVSALDLISESPPRAKK